MGICARAVLQPDGYYWLRAYPAETDLATCAYVVQSGDEWNNAFSLLRLSPSDALVISSSIAACWGLAFAFKMVIRSLKVDENVQE